MINFIKRILSSLIIIPIVFFFIFSEKNLFVVFIITCLIIAIYEWQKLKFSNFMKYFGYMFLLFSFYSVYELRYLNNDENLVNFLIIIIACISTDIGGYTFGKIFKGPKLTKISPNKTISGVCGGFLFPIIIVYFGLIYFDLTNKFTLFFCFYIIFISFVSQIGDLIISYFKRLSNVKDTGKLLPGHGGLLDRIDGMIFVFPVIYTLDFFR